MRISRSRPSRRLISEMLGESHESFYPERVGTLSREDIREYRSKVLGGKAKGRDFFIATEDDGSFAGMAVLEDLKWDTRWLGVKTAKIDLIVTGKNTPGRTAVYAALFRELLSECRDRKAKLVFFRNPAVNRALNRYLAGMEIYPVSKTVNLYCRFDRMKGRKGGPETMIRRPYRSEYPRIERLMEKGYRNRLLREPALKERNVRRLYKEWARNDLRGRVKETLVCIYGKRAAGFIAFDRVDINKKIYGFIDMIVVDRKIRRRGIGSLLMTAAAGRLRGRAKGILLGTEGDGRANVNFYRRLGFREAGTDYCFHIKPEDYPGC